MQRQWGHGHIDRDEMLRCCNDKELTKFARLATCDHNYNGDLLKIRQELLQKAVQAKQWLVCWFLVRVLKVWFDEQAEHNAELCEVLQRLQAIEPPDTTVLQKTNKQKEQQQEQQEPQEHPQEHDSETLEPPRKWRCVVNVGMWEPISMLAYYITCDSPFDAVVNDDDVTTVYGAEYDERFGRYAVSVDKMGRMQFVSEIKVWGGEVSDCAEVCLQSF
jgi:hypothetical protein